MKKIHLNIILTAVISLTLVLPSLALATDTYLDLLDEAGGQAGYDTTNTNTSTVGTIAGSVVRAFLSLTGIIFIFYTIYGGFLWMTSGGNEEKMTKAKHIIRNGIIGLILIFAAVAIYVVVLRVFLNPGSVVPSGPPGIPS